MENLPSVNDVIENKYFQIGMIVWVVFFSGCITKMVPDNVRSVLNNPVIRISVLAMVVYLANRDFNLAVVVAAGYFLSAAPLDLKEKMTEKEGIDCQEKEFVEGSGFVTGCGPKCDFIPAAVLEGKAASCKPKCSNYNDDNCPADRCAIIEGVCKPKCLSYKDENKCNDDKRCAVYGGVCKDKCNSHNEEKNVHHQVIKHIVNGKMINA